MRSFLIIFTLLFHNLQSFGQKLFLETFDSKQSINEWKINNNGVMLHTDHFTFDGETFYKKTKDSFLVFYDSSYNFNYGFTLKKTFKAIPCKDITFRSSVLSDDSAGDYCTAIWRILDKNKKVLFLYSLPQYSELPNQVAILGAGLTMKETQDDSLWQKADSMEISFHFNPRHPYDSFNRMVVIDEMYLENVFASIVNQKKQGFEIFPNPASKIIYFKFSYFLKPREINLYDYTGRLILTKENEEQLNVENLKTGFYFVTVQFENGATATKKLEIK